MRNEPRVAAELGPRDFERLRELRSLFLGLETGARRAQASYWRDRRDLELYDATFAQRIGWKWDAVLGELAARGVLPRGAIVLDWGCGTAIAARRFLAAAGASGVVRLFDRSRVAVEFARDAILREHPGATIELVSTADTAPDVLLVSHVLGELAPSALADLLRLVRSSPATIWVEAGSRGVSRSLSAVRDELARELDVVAPCTHRAACGMLAPENERGWCHGFARPPALAFTSAFWRQASRELEIDLRALPYSFLATRRRSPGPAEPARDLARILGRPRVEKGRARLDVCDASGVRALEFLQRTDRAFFRRLRDWPGELPTCRVDATGARIERVRRCPGESPC